jgi:hypothetical protein
MSDQSEPGQKCPYCGGAEWIEKFSARLCRKCRNCIPREGLGLKIPVNRK